MPSNSTQPTPGSAQPQAQAGAANIPPNGPDYGQAPPFPQPPPFGTPPFPGMPPFGGGMPFGAAYPGMHGFGMPPFPMPGYPQPGYAQPGFGGPGFGGPGYPGMDSMMSQMVDRSALMHRMMITMSYMAAEASRAFQLLAQNPSQIGMPFAGAPPAAGAGAGAPADNPVDMEALKQALSGMDTVQAQKTLYAVQMMQWSASMMRANPPPYGQPPNGQPPADQPPKAW